MGWLSIIAGAGAATLFFLGGYLALAGAAALVTVGAFWTYGVMHNFATDSAKRRRSYDGGFSDLSENDLNAVPNGLALLNLLASLACFGLLITAAIMVLV